MATNEALRAARGRRSVEEICKNCGISVSSYRKYESGSRQPRDKVKIKLSKFLGVSVSDLFF